MKGKGSIDEELEWAVERVKELEQDGDAPAAVQEWKKFLEEIEGKVDASVSGITTENEELELDEDDLREGIDIKSLSNISGEEIGGEAREDGRPSVVDSEPVETPDKPAREQALEDIEMIKGVLGKDGAETGPKESMYLKLMKTLKGFFAKMGQSTDYLDAMIFREEYVLPTINGLIEDNKKANAKMVLTPQMKEACEKLIIERNDFKDLVDRDDIDLFADDKEKYRQAVEEVFSQVVPEMSAKDAFLKMFSDVSEKAGDKNLARTCRQVMSSASKSPSRSVVSQAERLGEVIKDAKPQEHDKAKGAAQRDVNSNDKGGKGR